MRILYIDDTKYWRETVKEAFEKTGVKIKTLPDARGDILNETISFKPDLILLDISMPEVTGFEAIKIFKENDGTKNIPVFFFSALSDSSTIKKGLELGAERYLVKGERDINEVVSLCESYFNNNKI
jgi:DNA-binding response OmpR family regulator